MSNIPFHRLSAMLIVAIALAALGACGNPSRTQAVRADGNPQVRIERENPTFELGKGIERVVIDNQYGEINVRTHTHPEVSTHAVIQRLPPDFDKPVLRTQREGDSLHIEVSYPKAHTNGPQHGRIDLAVFVPTDYALNLRAGADRIDVGARVGAIEATTQSGNITASSRGGLNLQTESGTVRAAAYPGRWTAPSTISSDTGQIIVLVPIGTDLNLDAATGGRVTTDFGLSVHKDPNGTSRAAARYGPGTLTMQVRSRSGEIVLDQLRTLGDDKVLPEDDD